ACALLGFFLVLQSVAYPFLCDMNARNIAVEGGILLPFAETFEEQKSPVFPLRIDRSCTHFYASFSHSLRDHCPPG
ncbi:hypothetical protein PFISCL1PPCAC_730, partial [Pristionchus fissidentatus]